MFEEAAESLSAPKLPLRGPRSGIERLVPAPLVWSLPVVVLKVFSASPRPVTVIRIRRAPFLCRDARPSDGPSIRAVSRPWQKPWKPGDERLPKNIQTDKPYRGGNSIYLSVTQTAKGYSDNRWATYKQVKDMGGQVRKGEKATHVLFSSVSEFSVSVSPYAARTASDATTYRPVGFTATKERSFATSRSRAGRRSKPAPRR